MFKKWICKFWTGFAFGIVFDLRWVDRSFKEQMMDASIDNLGELCFVLLGFMALFGVIVGFLELLATYVKPFSMADWAGQIRFGSGFAVGSVLHYSLAWALAPADGMLVVIVFHVGLGLCALIHNLMFKFFSRSPSSQG